MYHSIIFLKKTGTNEWNDRKNTWDDWHLYPSSRPLVVPPKQKTMTVDLPGADGLIDLSNSITGKPLFNNREGSWEFIVANGFGNWADRYSEIMNYIHGQNGRIILEDDPDWYYEGRFSFDSWTSNSDGTWSTLTIGYNVGPYKYSLDGTTKKL